jgi:hypothetical protein
VVGRQIFPDIIDNWLFHLEFDDVYYFPMAMQVMKAYRRAQ